jgi:ribonucleotide reductase alpha subunit
LSLENVIFNSFLLVPVLFIIVGNKVNVWNGNKYSTTIINKTGTNKKLLKITFSNDKYIKCTSQHVFYLNKNNKQFKTSADKLKVGDKLINWNLPNGNLINNITVTSIDKVNGLHDTYCFTEQDRHMGMFNDILTGQCAEIIEYTDNKNISVCNLSSICLPRFIETNSQGKKFYNFNKLIQISRIVTNNLNRVIDVGYYPVEEARYSNMTHRPIGIGVQGLADVFCMLDLSFDSDEASILNKKIFESIYYGAVKESCELAKQHGSYETFKGSPASNGKLQFHLWGLTEDDLLCNYNWKSLIEDVKQYGMRNSLLTAIMPTASTSQIMTNNEAYNIECA